VREIVAGRNWANMKILVILGVMISGNVVFHLEAHFCGYADYGIRLGIGAAITAIMMIGGRSFTRSWLVRENRGRLPSPFGRFDNFQLVIERTRFGDVGRISVRCRHGGGIACRGHPAERTSVPLGR
jgi:uncharacterized protein involved in response to NO